jgi:hypothetical protein
MMICNKCGELCDDDDLPTYTEDFGFDTGVGWKSCPQTFVDNCSCGGDFVEATKCVICGEYFNGEEQYGKVCSECLKDESIDADNAFAIGDKNKEKIEVNGFLASIFDENQINDILEQAYRKQNTFTKERQSKEYCLDDETYFVDFLEEREKSKNIKK